MCNRVYHAEKGSYFDMPAFKEGIPSTENRHLFRWNELAAIASTVALGICLGTITSVNADLSDVFFR